MKILIIENEYASIKSAFEFSNLLNFNNELEIHNISKSQELNEFLITSSDVIFVDISLANKSQLDGIGIIKSLIEKNQNYIEKVIVITGNSDIEQLLKNQGVGNYNITIVYKPVCHTDITDAINKIIKPVK